MTDHYRSSAGQPDAATSGNVPEMTTTNPGTPPGSSARKFRNNERRGRRLQNVLTAAVGVIATTVQAQGMWNFFGDKFHVTNPWLRAGMFAFIELCILVSALRARRYRIDTGKVGLDGVAVWVLAVLSGALSATDADTAGGMFGRLVVPLVAAWMFERAISVERSDHVGFLSGIPWRITPERILVALRLADPTRRDVADVARAHRLAQLARYAYRVGQAKPGRQRRMRRRLVARMLKINAELRLATDPIVMAELRLNLATVFQALDGMTAEAVADLSPWRPSVERLEQEAELEASGGPELPVVVDPELPVPADAELPGGTSPEVPAELPPPVPVEGSAGTSAPDTPELPATPPTGSSGANFRNKTPRGSGGTSARKNGRKVPVEKPVRRTAEETRRLAIELASREPTPTKVEIAKELNVSDRYLRGVLNADDDQERAQVKANGHRPEFAGVA